MSKSNAAYIPFVATLAARLAEYGIEVQRDPNTETGFPQNKGWVKLETKAGHKVYVPRSVEKLGHLETTLTIPGGTPGYIALPERNRNGVPFQNGKIRSRFEPDVSKFENAIIPLLLGDSPVPTKRVAGVGRGTKVPAQPTSVSDRMNVTEDEVGTAEEVGIRG